ncbi:MAG: phosphotransferase [Pseudomonadota bacterium]
MTRDELKRRFLMQVGWTDATLHPMGSDASKRSYDRVVDTDRKAILMNAPYEVGEDIRPFIHVSALLEAASLSAPKIYAKDLENGFLLLEDLGDALYANHIKVHPESEAELYRDAVDLLAGISQVSQRGLTPYNESVYLTEASLFIDWYLPKATGAPLHRDLRAEYQELLATLLREIEQIESVITLRDYHAENLIWLPDRNGHRRVGLLDYQDALSGHPAYDLVSLLEDARRDTSAALQAEMFQRFLDKTNLDAVSFRYAYDILGAQRNLKIIGIFTRLCCRDGKQSYPNLIPRVWSHLMRDLTHPKLSNLVQWIEANAPKPTPDIIERIKAQNA